MKNKISRFTKIWIVFIKLITWLPTRIYCVYSKRLYTYFWFLKHLIENGFSDRNGERLRLCFRCISTYMLRYLITEVVRWCKRRTLKTETYCASQQTDRAYNESPSEGPDMRGLFINRTLLFRQPQKNVTETRTNSFKKILLQDVVLDFKKFFVLVDFLCRIIRLW